MSNTSSTDPSAIWWGPAFHGNDTAIDVPQHSLAPAAVALPVMFAIAGLVFSPCAIVAWITARAELRRVDAGLRSPRGRGYLVLAHVLGVGVTVFALCMVTISIALSA